MNPKCPFCGEVLKLGYKHNYHLRGQKIIAGRSKAWICKDCNMFWFDGKSVISKNTALKMDRRGVIENLKATLKSLLYF